MNEDYVDDFNDSTIDPRWTVDAPIGTIVESGGNLSITVPSTAAASFKTNAPLIYTEYDSQVVEVVVKVSSVDGNQYKYCEGLMLYTDRNNGFMIGYFSTNRIRVQRIVNGAFSDNVAQVYAYPVPGWFRIRHLNNTYYFEYSSDGITYSTLYSTSALGFTPSYVGMVSTTQNPISANISFDSFSVKYQEYIGLYKSLININQEKYTDWLWQNEIEITGSPDGQLTNYPVLITVPYNNQFMRYDFQDIRFGTDYGLNLPFFLRRKVDGDFAEFFVKIPIIPQSPESTLIYLYAGNDQAGDRSNGYNVFPFFDDFDEKYVTGLDTSKWNFTGGATRAATLDNSILTLTMISIANYCVLTSTSSFGQNYIAGLKLKNNALQNGDITYFGFDNSSNRYIREYIIPNTSTFNVNDAGTEDTGDDHRASYDPTQWHVYEFQNKPTGGIRENIDFVEVDNSEVNITTPLPVKLYMYNHNPMPQVLDIDYIYVRHSIDNEPTIGELSQWATTTHTDIFQANLIIPYYDDYKTLICIKPLHEDFQALLNITGYSEKEIKAFLNIKSMQAANYFNNYKATVIINPNASNKDMKVMLNIGKVLDGSIELKGKILYNYNRDESTIQGEQTNKQFVMKLGGRVYS